MTQTHPCARLALTLAVVMATTYLRSPRWGQWGLFHYTLIVPSLAG